MENNENRDIKNNLDKQETNVEESKEVETQLKQEEPKFEEVKIEHSDKEIRTDSYFDGKLLELIGWNLLRYLITLVTLGIASPWASCMYIRFKTSHTILNGKRLKFHGTGGEYFVEKFKWFFLTLITLGIYAFFIPVKKNRWMLSKLSFEDEELVEGESFFDGKTIQFIGINILCNFLNVISFGILYVFTKCFKLKWLAKHSIINRKRIVFDGSALNLFGHYLLWSFLTVITFGIYGLWLNIKLMQWEVKNSHIKVSGEEEKKNGNIVATVVIGIIAISISLTFILLVLIPVLTSGQLTDGFDGLNKPSAPVEGNMNGLISSY